MSSQAPTEAPAEALADPPMPGEEATSTEIVERNKVSQYAVDVMPLMTDVEIRQAWRTAGALAKSRMFKNVTQAEQAFAKILLGRDLGLSPTQSMMGLDLIEGNLQIRGTLLGSFIKRRKAEGYDYKVLERSHTKARIRFITPGGEDNQIAEFTIEDAQRARLTNKDNWQKHPRNMLFWRAMSDGVKAYCPEIMGGIPIYTEADALEARPAYSAGLVNDAEADQSAPLPPAVEAVIARAKSLGHAGLSDRGTVAMTLGDQPEQKVAEWVAAATAELDALEPKDAEVVDAEHTEGEAEHEEIATELQKRWLADTLWRDQVAPLLHRHADVEMALDGAVTEGDEDAACELRAELDAIEGGLEALGVPVGWMPTDRDANRI